MAALRCLLVDDNEAFLASATRLLERQGLRVVGRATSSADAMRLASSLLPDVILVDVQLGVEDGLELTRRLVADHEEIRVVLISTHTSDDLAELVAEAPAVGFLPKTKLSSAAIVELLG